MTSGTGLEQQRNEDRPHVDERVKGALVVCGGAAAMIGLAVGGLAMLTSPDSWLMKAANQAMLYQEAVATSYLVNVD
jgi:hypothetical protein